VSVLDALEEIKDLIIRVSDVEEVKETVDRILKSGVDPLEILNTLNQALDEVGRRYEKGEYFLSELIMAGVLSTEVTSLLEPHLIRSRRISLGKVVIGTVRGDIHDIGKNILIMMLRSAGFDVVDLGVDVPAENFANAIEEKQANILGMSALLTSSMDEMKKVTETIEKRGLRNRVKIVVGGRPLTREFAKEIGADGYAKDAVEAVKVIKDLV
jgi:5-methyltetrahydrofolate--homocysteine methyltransferase